MRIDIVGQAMAELPAIAADAVLPPARPRDAAGAARSCASEFQISFIDCCAHVADDQLAAPIEEAGTDQPVGIHRIAVENIGAGVGVADVLLVDALADLDAGMRLDVELRPAGREILDEDAVAMIAEGVEEFLALRLGDQLAGNLDDDFAVALVGVDPFDVVDECRRSRT